jgi:hypothetical protein
MTTQNYTFQAPPALAVAIGATTPNPGIVGVSVWSTTASATLTWNGTSWQMPTVVASEVDLTPQTAVPAGNNTDQLYAQSFGRQSALAVYPSQARGEQSLRLYEPAAWTHRKRTFLAPASGTTPVLSNWGSFTVTGTVAGASGPARLMYGTAATAGASAGVRASTGTVRGANGVGSTVGGVYGFMLAARLMWVPPTRFFFGLTGAALTNQDPVAGATANNSVGFYKDASDTGIGYMQRNTVAGIVNNTANALPNSMAFYDLVLSVARDTAVNLKVSYAWRRTTSISALTWGNWTVSEAALDGSSLTVSPTNLATFWFNNGTNAVDQYLHLVSMYQEQDWGHD